MGVFILKKIKDIPNGIGLCLEPLNNILSEKNSLGHSNQSAYITMTGEDVKKGDSKLSCDLNQLLNGDLLYLYGHPESFLSQKGKKIKNKINQNVKNHLKKI